LRIALAITSYERPDALAAVLASVARQTLLPDEIVIADDGSAPQTQALIAAIAARAAVPTRIVSQPHEGFRVARLRNLAIASTRAEYLLFVDGDMLLHPGFIADHARQARPGWFTQGVRVHADAALTATLLKDSARFPSPLDPGLGVLRRTYLLRSPAMARLCRRVANGFVAIKACNLGAWRDDLRRVNGFNEDIVGWGPEDKELCARLVHARVRRQTLLFGGIAVHLHHPAASRAHLPANLAVLETTRRERLSRCTHGLDSHPGT
jgi:glycosyltransferase involved in cell wall biosynthesis